MIPTNGLNHLALPVRDPERSARFYAELFNMRITFSSPETAFLKTVGRQDMIALNRSEVKVPSARNQMHFGFWVEPGQFDEAVRTIEENAASRRSRSPAGVRSDAISSSRIPTATRSRSSSASSRPSSSSGTQRASRG